MALTGELSGMAGASAIWPQRTVISLPKWPSPVLRRRTGAPGDHAICARFAFRVRPRKRNGPRVSQKHQRNARKEQSRAPRHCEAAES